MFRWNRCHDCDHALNPLGWVRMWQLARAGLERQPGRPGWGLSRPLVSSHGFLSSRGTWPRPLSSQDGAKRAPREALSKAFLSQNASGLRECYTWHAWMGFQPTQVQTSFFSLGERRWQEKKPKAQDVANIQVGGTPPLE